LQQSFDDTKEVIRGVYQRTYKTKAKKKRQSAKHNIEKVIAKNESQETHVIRKDTQVASASLLAPVVILLSDKNMEIVLMESKRK
jgi:hypothetical protein